jgi:hemoglobin/transferrin/lactoferrin receptor protein
MKRGPTSARRSRARPLRALVASLLLAGTCAGAASAATLAGRVVAREGGAALDGVVVRLLEAARQCRTGPDGQFAFADLHPGTYTVTTHHLAWADAGRAVRLADGAAADTLVLRLDPALYPADEIVVNSTRSLAPLRESPVPGEAWNAERLARERAVTVSDALAAMPGLALTRDGAWETALSIRGLGRSNVVALVDHSRIETATDLSGGLSLVDAADLERVEVVKSPGSVLFGSGAFGGAVNFLSRRPRFSDRASWSAELDEGLAGSDRGVSHHAAVEQASSRHALRLSGGWRGADDVRTPEGPVEHSFYSDWSTNAALSVRTAGEQSALVSWQRSEAEDTGIPGGKPIAASPVARYTLARRDRLALEYAVPNAWRAVPLLTLRASRQDITRNVEIRQGPGVLVTPHAVHATTSGQAEARLVPGRGQVVVAGVDAWQRRLDSRRERSLNGGSRVVGERPVPPASFLSAGVYAQHEWDPSPGRLHVVTGARWDRGLTRNDAAYNPEYVLVGGVPQVPVPGQVLLWPAGTRRDDSWSASAGAHVTLSPQWSLSASLATAYRSPSLEERFQFLDLGTSVHLGNPALAPERSACAGLGARLDLARTRVRADLFGNRLTDLVAETAGTWEGRPAWIKTNVGEARLYGFELSADHEAGRRLVLHAAAAYARGEDTGQHANLSQVAPLSGTLDAGYAAPGGTVHLACTMAHAQGNPGPDETVTPGFTVWSASFASREWRAGTVLCRLRAGAANLFDRPYRLHLSTLRGEVQLEPGRHGWAALSLAFGGGGAP